MIIATNLNVTQRNFFSRSAVPFAMHNRVVTAHTVTITAPTELGAALTGTALACTSPIMAVMFTAKIGSVSLSAVFTVEKGAHRSVT